MFPNLKDGRSYLQTGTTIIFDDSDSYAIAGEPIGCGGTGILYPVVALNEGERGASSIFVIKEYYPIGSKREETGEIIVPQNRPKGQLDIERDVSCKIFETCSGVTPVLKVYHQATISIYGVESTINNDYALMERLDQKAVVLSDVIKQKLPLWVSAHIVGNLLVALSGIHDAGFLHLDIKDNNIFLRDWDFNEVLNSTVTFIDFGSAIPLKETGETAPVKTRELFTTEGFAAPECLDVEQNYVSLTRSTDLFSVGCLLLYMILGYKITGNSIKLARRSSNFISKREADRMGFSPVGRNEINRILSRALRTTPSERYQSAQKMLSEIRRFERLVSPSPDPLDIVDWEAFISYAREDALEEKARMIQQAIEHYRIPPQIRRSAGIKRLGRVYIPQTDATSRADETDHRNSILKNSRTLIVLLSKSSGSSKTVLDEVSVFLDNHKPENIILIRADECDMKKTIPSSLRGQYVVDGVRLRYIESITQPADLRETTRRQFNKELARIIAPMIGYSPDELIEREKQYRNRRTLAYVAAAALIIIVISFLGTSVYHSEQKKLATENVVMTDAAAALFQEGDRAGAIRKLMEVLPSKDNKRPYYAAAESALVDYLYPYYDSELVNTYCPIPGTAIPTKGIDSNSFVISSDGSTIYTWCSKEAEDNDSVLMAYNSFNGNLKWTKIMDGPIIDCHSTSDGGLIILQNSGLLRLSMSGSEEWAYDRGEQYYWDSFSFLGSGESRLLVEDNHIISIEDSHITSESVCSLVSNKDGTLIQEIPCLDMSCYNYCGIVSCWDTSDRVVSSIAFSEDCSMLAILWYGSKEDGSFDCILTIDDIDNNTRETVVISEQNESIINGFVGFVSEKEVITALVQCASGDSEKTVACQMRCVDINGDLVQEGDCNYECPEGSHFRGGLLLQDGTLMLNMEYGILGIDANQCEGIGFISSKYKVLSVTDVSHKLRGESASYVLLSDGRFEMLSQNGKWNSYEYAISIDKDVFSGISFTGDTLTAAYQSYDYPDRLYTLYFEDFEAKAETTDQYYADAAESEKWGYEVNDNGIRIYSRADQKTLLQIPNEHARSETYGKLYDVPGEGSILLCLNGENEDSCYGIGYYIDIDSKSIRQRIPKMCGFDPKTRDIWIRDTGYFKERLLTTEELVRLAHEFVD